MSAEDQAAPSAFRLEDVDGEQIPPLVLASPHSGHELPAGFLQQTRLPPFQLRRLGDCFVDELLTDARAHGVPMIAARYSRTYVDLNRSPAELDPSILDPAPPPDEQQMSERVAVGLGVIPRVVQQGVEIYCAKIDLAEAARRISTVHAPYHEAIRMLLRRAFERHGYAVLLDCHSMPTPYRTGPAPAQFVLGDLFGRSADPRVTRHLEESLTARGMRVLRNEPYAGGYTTQWHAAPAEGFHVVQIEIDRSLYMDQRTLARHAGFSGVTQLLGEVVGRLLAFLARIDLRPPRCLAAE